MDFNYSENQTIISETIKDFSKREIVPYMNEWDEKQIFPIELFKKIGNLGMMGVLVPEEYGGSGLSYDEYVTIISELSKVCGSIGLSVAAHNSLCTGHILKFGNEDQKRKYLPKLASAEYLARNARWRCGCPRSYRARNRLRAGRQTWRLFGTQPRSRNN